MRDKQRFAFLIRPNEREILKKLSEAMDRSEGATLRTLIRQAGKEMGKAPAPADLPHDRPQLAEVTP